MRGTHLRNSAGLADLLLLTVAALVAEMKCELIRIPTRPVRAAPCPGRAEKDGHVHDDTV